MTNSVPSLGNQMYSEEFKAKSNSTTEDFTRCLQTVRLCFWQRTSADILPHGPTPSLLLDMPLMFTSSPHSTPKKHIYAFTSTSQIKETDLHSTPKATQKGGGWTENRWPDFLNVSAQDFLGYRKKQWDEILLKVWRAFHKRKESLDSFFWVGECLHSPPKSKCKITVDSGALGKYFLTPFPPLHCVCLRYQC